MITKIRIYDLDGTVIDSTHRYRTIFDHEKNAYRIDLQHWRDNEHRAYEDKLLPMADQYKMDIADPTCFVVVATARVMREPDFMFLIDNLGSPDYIIYRGVNDTRSGKELKVNGLRRLFSLKQFANIKDRIFYEDNVDYLKAVCDAFQMRGVYIPSQQGH